MLKRKIKYIIIGVIVLIVLILVVGFIHDYNLATKPLVIDTPINVTYSITSIRTAEQYNNLQTSFPTNPEIAACNFDLNREYHTAGVCSLNSVAEQQDGDYIIVCSCEVSNGM